MKRILTTVFIVYICFQSSTGIGFAQIFPRHPPTPTPTVLPTETPVTQR